MSFLSEEFTVRKCKERRRQGMDENALEVCFLSLSIFLVIKIGGYKE
jgi:hypothetical protein